MALILGQSFNCSKDQICLFIVAETFMSDLAQSTMRNCSTNYDEWEIEA